MPSYRPNEERPLSAAQSRKARAAPDQAVPTLVNITQRDLDWLEEQRVARGLKSRAEVLRAVFAEARGK